jgi:HPt (histidine-containing phosphotransfer) domain-containing protein
MASLDLAHLKRIVGDDPSFIRQVLQIFVRNTPEDMKALFDSVESQSFDQVSFYAHKLKSAAGAIGYNEAYEDFKRLEVMSKQMAPWPEITAEVARLSGQCQACMVDIEDILGAL